MSNSLADGGTEDLSMMLNDQYFNLDEDADKETEPKKENVNANQDSDKEISPKKENVNVKQELDEEKPPVSMFEKELEFLSVSKNDILNMILELSDKGFIEARGAILNGKIPYEIRSTTVKQGMRMSELFEARGIKTEVAAKDFFAIHVLAGFLYSLDGEVLPDSLEDRVKWIEDRMSGIVFKALKNKAILFSRKTDLLTFEEVEVFL